ncbi:hypothetical protein FBU30_007848 [Linnemannia zychae]|nr:hypothetical protein FBU30_007848 [Linnemannia zychae]
MLLTALVLTPTTWANTEKVIFTVHHSKPSKATQHNGNNKDAQQDAVNTSSWKILTSPYTMIRAEKIIPSFYENDVTIASQKTRVLESLTSGSQFANEQSNFVNLQSRQFIWYALKNLEDNASFELRISYPATSPADFEMSVWTFAEAQEWLPSNISLLDHFPTNTMFARIKATYTGVSYLSNGDSFSPETLPIPFNLVLERLYFMIPYQALKLAGVIAVVAVAGLGYVVPRIYCALLVVATQDPRSRKTD